MEIGLEVKHFVPASVWDEYVHCAPYVFFWSNVHLLIFPLFLFVSFSIFSEGKIPAEVPAILPPLPLVPKSEKRKSYYGALQSSKRFDYRDWDSYRDRDRDFELMPPPGSHKREFTVPLDIDQPIDPNEPTYCVCNQVLILSPKHTWFSSNMP